MCALWMNLLGSLSKKTINVDKDVSRCVLNSRTTDVHSAVFFSSGIESVCRVSKV